MICPIFIGGCDRSGTTLLGALLGAHSNCVAVPESQFKLAVLHETKGDPNKLDPKSLIKFIKNHWRFKLWNLEINEHTVPAFTKNVYTSTISWLIQQYSIQQNTPNATYWIDHTPSNMKYGLHLNQLFPSAKFIHIVRDGRAVANSVMQLDWGPNTIFHATRWWAERVVYGLALESSQLQNKILRVRYEDLVINPETSLRRLCEFINIPFETSMMSGNGLNLPSYTQSQHQLVGQPPDRNRVQHWKKELSPREIEMFEALTGDLLYSLGYPLEVGLHADNITTQERILLSLVEITQRQVNKIRYRRRLRKK